MKQLALLLLFLPTALMAQTDSISLAIAQALQPKGKNHVQSIIFHIEKPKQRFRYSQGFGVDRKGGNPISKDARFRIASITKTFVATVVLQLVEEQKLWLEDKASVFLADVDFLNFPQLHLFEGKPYAAAITIEQLLSHRTGLADIFNDAGGKFYLGMYFHKKRQYTPKAIVGKYYQYQLNESPHFEPDSGFFYSDMNYVLLGLIIEKVTQQPLAEVLRERIIRPLEMENTFFEFYEEERGKQPQVHQYFQRIDMTRINTSFDWAGGGLVSNTKDLAVFIKALFGGKLISQQVLSKMIAMKFTGENQNRYGLGLNESEYNGKNFYGHYGFYGSYLGYCPEDETVLIYNISQSKAPFSKFKLAEQVLKYTTE